MAVTKVEGRRVQDEIKFRVARNHPLAKTFETEGVAKIHGQDIPYKAICEDVVFEDLTGKPLASIFTYSYFRTDVETSNRPVAFSWNGGPGSSCIWLHMGMLGIKRIKFDDPLNVNTKPPFEVEDNPHCLLDVCDFVFVDPVATGFSQIYDDEGSRMFHGHTQDAYSLTCMIEYWLTKYDRWNSPRFLYGESYGVTRAMQMSYSMMLGGGKCKLIPVNGMILMGAALQEANKPTVKYQEDSVLNLPMFAATNWWYDREGKGELEDFKNAAMKFVEDEYVRALYMGNRLSVEEKDHIAERLEYFTGVRKEFFLSHHLRLERNEFRVERLPGKNIGWYDTRFNMDSTDQAGEPDMLPDDEAMGQFSVGYANIYNEQLRKFLGIDDGRPFVAVNDYINANWDNKYYRSTTECLVAALRRNKTLKMFFIGGCFDMSGGTYNTRQILSQLDIPQDQFWLKEYVGGHMPYIGEDGAEPLEQDLRKFFRWVLEDSKEEL